MTTIAEGWAFLVGRGSRTVYRTVLSPRFLVDENLQHLLAESTGATGADRVRVVEVDNAQVGPFTIAYSTEHLTAADVEAVQSDGVELLTDEQGRPLDEHGRPLEIVYGIVSRERLESPLDAADLRTARARALQSYRSFLADEQGRLVDVSVAFALRTRGRGPAAAASGPAVSHDVATTVGERIDVPSRPRFGSRRVRAAGAAAVGVAALVTGLLVATAGPEQASTVRPAWAVTAPTGLVRICAGEDVSGSQQRSEKDYNRRFDDSRATLVSRSSIADPAHDRYRKSVEAGKDGCDVIYLDVAYMKEFVAKGLLYDMTPYLAPREGEFDDAMITTVKDEGRLWGVPKQMDVGVLYYRADRARAPSSWQDVYRRAKRRSPEDPPRLRLPLGEYEGSTVAFLELAYAAGARPIVTADGKTAQIVQPQVLAALRFLRDARRDGVIPAIKVQTDGGNLSMYELGRATFLRDSPSAAQRIRADITAGRAQRARRNTVANTRIVSLPPWKPGGQSVGVLGGHNLVIPRSARNPSAALRLIDYLTSPEQVRKDEQEASQFPVLKDVANELDLRNPQLIRAIKATKVVARPSVARYAEVSTIISRGVNVVLDGPADAAFARDELKEIQRDVQSVLDRGPT